MTHRHVLVDLNGHGVMIGLSGHLLARLTGHLLAVLSGGGHIDLTGGRLTRLSRRGILVVDLQICGGTTVERRRVMGGDVDVLGWKFMSLNYVKSCVNLLSWLLIS